MKTLPSEYEEIRLRLKIEINCREHLNLLAYDFLPFEVNNSWFAGKTNIRTFQINELLGTKLRALFQRSKGRDLFDLDYSRKHMELNLSQVIDCYRKYITFSTGKKPPSRKEFTLNMDKKQKDPGFLGDMEAIIRSGVHYDQDDAFEWLRTEVITLM